MVLAKRKKSRGFNGLDIIRKGGFIFIVFLGTLIILSRSIQQENILEETESSQTEFIDEVAIHANTLKEKHGLLPSVTIAQAIVESNWGQSGLSIQENNYFGIKGNSDNKQYVTLEYEEEWVEIYASFRSYPSLEASVEDYGRLLANGTEWNPELYAEVIEAETYEQAAYALREAGYATDPTYPEKIISIIEQYQLYEYD